MTPKSMALLTALTVCLASPARLTAVQNLTFERTVTLRPDSGEIRSPVYAYSKYGMAVEIDSTTGGASRLEWTLIGAGVGAGLGVLLVGPAFPFSDEDRRLEAGIGGAVLGGLAGFIISGPPPSDDPDNQSILGANLLLLLPSRGGVGVVVRL